MGPKRRAWRMVALGFLATNLAIGLTAGMYGAFIIPFSESFGVSRAVASSGVSIMTLVVLGSGPWVGSLLSSHEIRNVMTAGAALMTAGFALLSLGQSAWMILLLFSVLGLGSVLLGPLPVMTLMTNWYEQGRGRAIAIALLPVGIMLMPVVTTFMIEQFGWRMTFAGFALLLVAAAPILRLVRNHPPDRVAPAPGEREPVADTDESITRHRLRDIDFWLIAVGADLIIAGNMAFATHVIAYARGLGIDPQRAAMLISAWGGAAMLGSYLFGWMSDRLGAAAALTAISAAQMLLWLALWQGGAFEILLVTSALIGVCGGGFFPALSTMLSVRYGAESFSRTFGLAMLIQLPSNFGAPLLMGFLFDATGNYGAAILVHVALFAIAATVFARYVRTNARIVSQ